MVWSGVVAVTSLPGQVLQMLPPILVIEGPTILSFWALEHSLLHLFFLPSELECIIIMLRLRGEQFVKS
jgi:hypothetical protein